MDGWMDGGWVLSLSNWNLYTGRITYAAGDKFGLLAGKEKEEQGGGGEVVMNSS